MLPTDLYTAQQVRELDRVAIEEQGIPGLVLMKTAGKALFRDLLRRWPAAKKLLVCCGGGNNGGDGYIVAGLAVQRGIQAKVLAVAAPDKLKSDAKRAYDWAVEEGVEVLSSLGDESYESFDVIVDALLGTGLSGPVRSDYETVIENINEVSVPVIAADIPSGICSDTGVVLGCAVRANATVTFIGLKQGLITGAAPDYVGDLVFSDLQVPSVVYESVACEKSRIDYQLEHPRLKPRAKDSHKGSFGHVLVIGGDHGMGGAAAMAAEAALRSGAGMVSVATRADHVASILSRTPEIMVRGVKAGAQIQDLIEKATVIVVGPGLGRSPWSQQMLQFACEAGKPMVLDADGLNLLAEGKIVQQTLEKQGSKRDNWVLTPHPGEASRLLNKSTKDIQKDRLAAAKELQATFGGSVVLKGAGSIVAEEQAGKPFCSVCTDGNPGMATAGMGDVLSGVIGAFIAQGFSVAEAAKLGVCVHAGAADVITAKRGERGLVATDIIKKLPQMVNPTV